MAELLKNMYNPDFVKQLAEALAKADTKFDSQSFISSVLNKDWDNLELKARGEHITRQMHQHLPYDYPKQIKILSKIVADFSGFPGIIFPTFVELYGLEHYAISMQAMEKFTPYSSAEFAIRPFLKDHPEKTLKIMQTWAKSENYHVRRLASEGCRPLLPWGMKLHDFVKDPTPLIPILETLRNDPEDYVYRSVANNLNDISKNQPDLVLDLTEKWINETKTTQWVCKHALRTLLKKGNQRAMLLFGFGAIKNINVTDFNLKKNNIKLGDATQLNIDLTNTGKKAKFRVEYAIGYFKKNGKHSEKVFHVSETELDKNDQFSTEKKLDFKDLTTRKHYAGPHYVFLKINGNPLNKLEFELV